MKYQHFIDRGNDEIFAFDMDDEAQVAAIKQNLDPLSDEEFSAILVARDAANSPTSEQLAAMASIKRDELLAQAALRIAPLQDAADLDEATPTEISDLKKWKQYRILVNRVTSQAGFPSAIEWPEQPK